jgi:transketolase C-terminal domain/subunit
MEFFIDVIDLHQIKPIKDELIKVLENRTKILVVEESYNSILGKTLSLELSKLGSRAQFVVLDVGEKFYFSGSSRSEMENLSGISKLEISSLIKKIIGIA